VRRIDVDERRARLAVRHHLAVSAADPVTAARGVVVLHATDPASVFLAVHARTAPVEVQAIEHALYDERALIRMLGMRRTMFVVPVELAPVIQAACTKEIAARQRRTYTKLLSEAGVGDGAWLREVEDSTAKALAARGEATGAQLSADEPRLRTQLLVAEGKPYAAKQNITTWVLFMLAADGRIVRGRPRGSWTSSQYHWAPAQTWLPDGISELPVEDSRVELVRRWLAAFGPGTVADLKWWTGWTAGQVKHALAAVGPAEVDLNGQTGLVLADDIDPVDPPERWVALLPALDPTAMGWSERSWYLGRHGPALFDRSGNIGPTVWSDGRIVGGWAQRSTGEVVCRQFEDVGREVAADIETQAAKLADWIGPVRVTPRFRTPLERELSA
jgi:Winged helix DNA-binding domain